MRHRGMNQSSNWTACCSERQWVIKCISYVIKHLYLDYMKGGESNLIIILNFICCFSFSVVPNHHTAFL